MTTRDEATSYAAELSNGFRRRELLAWIMAARDDDTCIGTTTLYALNPKHLKAEVGYALRADRWGRGHAKEAVQLALRCGFASLGFNRIGADGAPGNDASIGLLTRLGFRHEGHLRENFCTQAELQDSLVYGMVAAEWRARLVD